MIRFTKKTIILGSAILCIISSAITFLSLFLTGLVDISAPIDLTIQLSDNYETQYKKNYDGLPYEPSSYALTSGRLQTGDYLQFIDIDEDNMEEYASVGTYECKKLFKIYNSDDEDVTKKYNLKVSPATVEIVKREISLEYSFDDLQYGDEIADITKFNITKGSIPEGQILKPSIAFKDFKDTYAIPNIYLSKDLELGAIVYDKNGKDVSSNYEFNCISSGINVIQREIRIDPTVTEYKISGKNIEIKNNYKVSEGTILDGHQLECSFGSVMSLAGKHKTTINAKIVDQNGIDITKYYSYNSDEEFTINIIGDIIEINLSPTNILQKEFDGKSFEDTISNIIQEQYKKIDSSVDNEIEIKFSDRIVNYIYYDPVNVYLEITDDDISVNHKSYSFVISPCTLEIKKRTLKIYAPKIKIDYEKTLKFDENFDLYSKYSQIESIDTKYDYDGLLSEMNHSVKFGDANGKLKKEYFNFERYGESIINVGFYEYSIFNEFIRVIYTNPDGKEIDVSSSYDIQMLGFVEVVPKEISICTLQGKTEISKVYTGEIISLKDELWHNINDEDLQINNLVYRNLSDFEPKSVGIYTLQPISATIIEKRLSNKGEEYYYDASNNYTFNNEIILNIERYKINISFLEKEFTVKSKETNLADITKFIELSNITLANASHFIDYAQKLQPIINLSEKGQGMYSISDLFSLSENTNIFKITDRFNKDVTANYMITYLDIDNKNIKFSKEVITLNLPTITQKKGCDSETILADLCADIRANLIKQLEFEESFIDTTNLRVLYMPNVTEGEPGVYSYTIKLDSTTSNYLELQNTLGTFIITE